MAPRLDLIGMVSTDLPRSLAFYRRLGLDIPADADTEQHVEITLPGGLRVAWDTAEVIRSFDANWRPGGGGGASLAFRCADPGEVDRLYAELVAAGYAGNLPPWDADWGQRYAVIDDPDGNGVSLFAPSTGPTAAD